VCRLTDAATLLGVSDDTVRRGIDTGSLPAQKDASRRKVSAGDMLHAARSNAPDGAPDLLGIASLVCNRFVGPVNPGNGRRGGGRS